MTTGGNPTKEEVMSIETEERRAGEDVSSIIEGGLIKYKEALKVILQMAMEELYGGGKDEPKCNEDNEQAIIKIWDKAVESCIKIVKDL
jgi:hypothetical protein